MAEPLEGATVGVGDTGSHFATSIATINSIPPSLPSGNLTSASKKLGQQPGALGELSDIVLIVDRDVVGAIQHFAQRRAVVRGLHSHGFNECEPVTES